MGVYAVYIEKEEKYFGGLRRFGNIYHLETSPGQTFQDDVKANEIASLEKKVTSSEVEFVAWRTWGPTDGPIIDNIIRADGQLAGNGGANQKPAMYREACFLFTWPLDRSRVLNRKRWLRKFIRCPGFLTEAMSDAVAAGTDAMDAGQISSLNNLYTAPMDSLGGVDPTRLCTALGDVPNGPGTVRPFLYTRQIGS